MSDWIHILEEIMRQNLWVAPLLSLAAGIISSLTPCSLASIPMILAYVGATSATPKKAFRLSLAMALGMAVTFGVFGSVASAIGHMMHEAGHWWKAVMGILMILMALQIWEVIHIIPHIHMTEKVSRRGYTGAFLTGALSGLFASHCAVPVMVALLALAAEVSRGIGWGILLMVCYAVGHSILLLLAGTGYGYVEQMMKDPRLGAVNKWLRIILGVIILAVGLVMLLGES
ncbi:MAG TPA: cytochrome c biogenesis protein CcdA [Candidatus Blautia avistercoris]|nr:cytochrome c biogenesis protein CcdA [Candidatus Blautia avistercoris]